MSLSSETLATIVGDARTLDERLRRVPRRAARADAAADPQVDVLVARWRAALAASDDARWSRRLAWDGLDERGVRAALAAPARAGRLPAWGALLAEVADVAAAGTDVLPARDADGERPDGGAPERDVRAIPFVDLLWPFVAVATRRVAAARGGWGALGPAPVVALERALAEQLAGLARRALYAEFARGRAGDAGGEALGMLGAALAGGSRRRYDAFVRANRADGMAALWRAYPVLARLLATRTLHWVRNAGALGRRLAADGPALAATFLGGVPDVVVGVDADLSDPHRGARSVAILRFARGARVVYKPRRLAVDRAFQALVAWLSARAGGPPLRGLALVDRGGYGWVEHADVAPCDSAAAVERYFERGGMLLAIAHVLGASDLHSANVLACGEHPTLVDLEVLFHPIVDTGVPPDRDGRSHATATVLATALLPTRSSSGGVDYVDGGLFEPLPAQRYQREVVRFPNTDLMAWGTVTYTGGGHRNVPVLAGVPARARDHLDALRRGFGRMYDAIVAHRAALLAPGGPLAACADVEVRVVHRPTAVYDQLAARTLQPAMLRRGVDRSLVFETLRAGALALGARPALWPVLGAEQRELEGADVPIFSARPGARALRSGGGATAERALHASGLARAAARIRALGPRDRARQLDLVRVAYAGAADYARRLAERAPAERAPAERAFDDTRDAAPASFADVDRAAARAEARRIGDTLLALRRDAPGGGWIGLTGTTPDDKGLRSLEANLFDGTVGVALFLATLHRETGEARFADAARSALRPLRRRLRDARAREALADRIGIGGAYGMGSLAYGLARIARALDDAGIRDDASRAAATIDAARVAGDARLDVMFGAAGALLALLALQDDVPDPALHARAERCAAHLVRAQLGGHDALAGHWLTGYGSPQTGFAHGTAGILAALARHAAHPATRAAGGPSPALRAALDAARRALDACFEPAHANWRDVVLPDPRQPAPWVSWCRGAAGIGLAGLALAEVPGMEAASLVEPAVAACLTRAHPAADHPCCGTGGRIELLLTAAERLDRPALRDAAAGLAAGIRAARVARGSHATGFVPDLSPGLFQGIAGIGHAMLRVAAPDAVPAVLRWQ